MPSESSATTTTASVLAPRLMANEPAIGQRSTRTERARGLTRSTLGLLPPPTKPQPAGVWSLKNLPEAGKPAAGWGRGGEARCRWCHLRKIARPPPPTPPHKGEGSTPSMWRQCASKLNLLERSGFYVTRNCSKRKCRRVGAVNDVACWLDETSFNSPQRCLP